MAFLVLGFLMYTVYIICSAHIDQYYNGMTEDFDLRLSQHNTGYFKGASTKRANDWSPFYLIPTHNKSVALKIETHIKSMKSRTYIENLRRYPEITKKLLMKYK